MKTISIIVAVHEETFGIGLNGKLPWHIPEDLEYFKNVTTFSPNKDKKNVVLMGRKTWESIPKKFRPLKGRINVILSKTLKPQNEEKECFIFDSLELALDSISKMENVGEIFAIGGQQIYEKVLKLEECKKIYLSKVSGKNLKFDTFFPKDFSTIRQDLQIIEALFESTFF